MSLYSLNMHIPRGALAVCHVILQRRDGRDIKRRAGLAADCPAVRPDEEQYRSAAEPQAGSTLRIRDAAVPAAGPAQIVKRLFRRNLTIGGENAANRLARRQLGRLRFLAGQDQRIID
ncbi:hypothetical protein AJ87_06205 [Rhizobium yanglingense]|nr:hypothetical protein AJ87_06205 [Rhizobium yanglingense]